MKNPIILKISIGGALLSALVACGGGGEASGQDNAMFQPAMAHGSCAYDAVNVTVQQVSVHQSTSADDAGGDWHDVVLNPAVRINLVGMTNGVLATLGQAPLDSGKYTQLRLVLADNTSSNPLANSVVPTGGSETALKTPSGQQSGVKMNIDITIAPNQSSDFLVNFDACKYVVSAGNSGQYLLKPVIRTTPITPVVLPPILPV